MEFECGLIASDERFPKKVREIAENLKKIYKKVSTLSLEKSSKLAQWHSSLVQPFILYYIQFSHKQYT